MSFQKLKECLNENVGKDVTCQVYIEKCIAKEIHDSSNDLRLVSFFDECEKLVEKVHPFAGQYTYIVRNYAPASIISK